MNDIEKYQVDFGTDNFLVNNYLVEPLQKTIEFLSRNLRPYHITTHTDRHDSEAQLEDDDTTPLFAKIGKKISSLSKPKLVTNKAQDTQNFELHITLPKNKVKDLEQCGYINKKNTYVAWIFRDEVDIVFHDPVINYIIIRDIRKPQDSRMKKVFLDYYLEQIEESFGIISWCEYIKFKSDHIIAHGFLIKSTKKLSFSKCLEIWNILTMEELQNNKPKVIDTSRMSDYQKIFAEQANKVHGQIVQKQMNEIMQLFRKHYTS